MSTQRGEIAPIEGSETEGAWLEAIPSAARWRSFAWRAAIGLCFAIALWIAQWKNGVLDAERAWLGLIPVGLGLLFGKIAYAKTEVRRFATHEVTYTKKQRFVRAANWWGTSVIVLALVWAIQFLVGQFHDYWFYGLLALAIAIPGFGLYHLKRGRELTPQAAKLRPYYEQLDKQTKDKRPGKWEWLDKPVVRYSGVALLLFGAYYFWFEYQGQDRDAKGGAIFCLIFAAMLAREVMQRVLVLGVWVLVLGLAVAIVWALFSGLSALPVSVAIIIGALIIASAVRR